ncbi:72 kDa inositol polyphosphate 5-phosphatase-like [Limulus polyphemus]|uniref:72 kDa inositol polyphosphate 5-phosphatase-like n=1 Tax=Limulus polyphemus TaxID=6850 RepID=A0ABM1SUA4_LIMPO|nr:72 kDa inositol polyphosphate 5-phosphatase-like [Limulus polyphemus]
MMEKSGPTDNFQRRVVKTQNKKEDKFKKNVARNSVRSSRVAVVDSGEVKSEKSIGNSSLSTKASSCRKKIIKEYNANQSHHSKISGKNHMLPYSEKDQLHLSHSSVAKGICHSIEDSLHKKETKSASIIDDSQQNICLHKSKDEQKLEHTCLDEESEKSNHGHVIPRTSFCSDEEKCLSTRKNVSNLLEMTCHSKDEAIFVNTDFIIEKLKSDCLSDDTSSCLSNDSCSENCKINPDQKNKLVVSECGRMPDGNETVLSRCDSIEHLENGMKLSVCTDMETTNDISTKEALSGDLVYVNNFDNIHSHSFNLPVYNVKHVPSSTNISKMEENENKNLCFTSGKINQNLIKNYIEVEDNVGWQSCVETAQNEEMIKNVLKQVSRRLSQVCQSDLQQFTVTDSSTSQSDKTLPHINPSDSQETDCALESHTYSSKPGSASSLLDLAKKYSSKDYNSRKASSGNTSLVSDSSHSYLAKQNNVEEDLNSSKKPLKLEPLSIDKPLISKSLESLNSVLDSPELHRSHSATQSVMSSVEGVLPLISVCEARSRCYVVGTVGSQGSLLGPSELLRYFPDQKVSVFVGTWNMNGQLPPKNLDDFLLPLGVNHLPDIYAVGVQEGVQDRKEWEITLQTTLGPSHVLFHSVGLGVLYLSIFLRRDLIWFCSDPEDATYSTRPGSAVKTKGAVAVSFMFFGTSLLFINSHLTAHEKKIKERLSDYEKICLMLDLPRNLPLKSQYQSKDVTARFDSVFWCGDLNFRLTQKRDFIIKLLEERSIKNTVSCKTLLNHDQLKKAMGKGVAFRDFHEAEIMFVPSYKYSTGSSLFDSKKLRVPSYTDRVLFRHKKNNTITCLLYDIAESITTSDHKPIYALFQVCVKPGRDNIPLAAGLFNREVYLEASRRRAAALENQDRRSSVCSLM